MLAATRPPFLLLVPATVLPGLATALRDGAILHWGHLAAALLGALAAHVAVNTLNEYQDFRSGLDDLTERTPFSGGSGALPGRPRAAGQVLLAALLALAVTVVVGLYLARVSGPAIVPLGLAGLAIILSYTRWLNRHPWLCLLAPGLGFGPLMVAGSHYALSGSFGWPAWLAGLVCLCSAANLLLLNQYPDLDADRRVGRRTFPIAYGIGPSNAMYAALLAGAALLLCGAVAGGAFPPLSLLTLAALLPGLAAWRRARRFRGEVTELLPALGLNVAAALLVPATLGLTLLLA